MSGKEQSYNLDLESIQNLNFKLDTFKARYVQLIPVRKKMGLNPNSHLLPKQQQNMSIFFRKCELQKINKIQRIFQMKISFNNSFFGSLNKL